MTSSMTKSPTSNSEIFEVEVPLHCLAGPNLSDETVADQFPSFVKSRWQFDETTDIVVALFAVFGDADEAEEFKLKYG